MTFLTFEGFSVVFSFSFFPALPHVCEAAYVGDDTEEPPEWSNAFGSTGATFNEFVEWDHNLANCALQNKVGIIAEVALPEAEESSGASDPEDEKTTHGQKIAAFVFVNLVGYSNTVDKKWLYVLLKYEENQL